MIGLCRIGIAVLLAACLAGCARTAPLSSPSAVVTSPRAKQVAAERIGAAVAVGKSTKSDVLARFGETLVIRFDSGYEVWVYQVEDDERTKRRADRSRTRSGAEKTRPGATAEFVILFAPSGVVAKTRLRPAPEGA
jgi:outer membrane lipoprotein SlyB